MCCRSLSGRDVCLYCWLHTGVTCTLSVPNLAAVSPELELSPERLPKLLSWTLSRDAGWAPIRELAWLLGREPLQSHPFHAHCSWSNQTIVCRASIAELHAWNWMKIPTPQELSSKSSYPQLSGGDGSRQACVCIWSCSQRLQTNSCLTCKRQQAAVGSLGALF